MTEKEKMLAGELYLPGDEEIINEQLLCLELLYKFNFTKPHEQKERNALMKEMFSEIGDNCYIEPPFHANFGGKHVHMGNNVYMNFNCTLVDDGEIFIGDNCLFAPNVVIATAAHPIDPELRAKGYQYNMPVRIGKNVWLGAGVLVMPSVTIGDNSVIGAGSVVTHDIPENCVAHGNPCKVVRKIDEHDKHYYFRDRKIEL